MQIITEETVRQIIYKQKLTELSVEPNAYISTEAKRYIREKGLKLVQSGVLVDEKKEPAVNKDIRPVNSNGDKPRFTDALTGQVYEKKPEYMTHLHGTALVVKNHPRIVLRGKLDSLEAEFVLTMVHAREAGQKCLVEDLNELLMLARRILGAEVTGKPLCEQLLLGMDDTALRAVSHDPKGKFGRGHIMPSAELSPTGARLNMFRARVREVELAAVDAFWVDGELMRPDLIKALNRMSSACYIMMFYELAGRYEAPHAQREGQ